MPGVPVEPTVRLVEVPTEVAPLISAPRAAAAAAAAAAGRWVTWRSLAIGSVVAAAVAAVGPFNDYVVGNTFLVGSFFPPVLVLTIFVLVVGVNAPLHRFAPRHALSRGELGVVLAMLLAACSIPAQGLMRGWIPEMIYPFRFGQSDPKFWGVFTGMHLPRWLFPADPTARDSLGSHVVQWFYLRVQPGASIPYGAWVVPFLGWGVFFGAMFTTLVALAVLALPQWAVNERLPFPLAQVELSLIEPPAPGKMLNALFRSPLFWVGLAIAFVAQSWVALNLYFPGDVPKLPLSFDLTQVLTDEPWVYLPVTMKSAKLYFTFIGVSYFIQSRMALSLWLLYVIEQVGLVPLRRGHVESIDAAWQERHIGACVAYVAGAVWVGRHYWLGLFRRSVARGAEGKVAPSKRAGAVALGGAAVMLGWLTVVGVSPWVAVLTVGMVVLGHVVTARVVAETGLPFFRAFVYASSVYTNVPVGWTTNRDVFFASAFTSMTGSAEARESVMAFVQHGLSAARAVGGPAEPAPPAARRRSVLGAVAWALVLSGVVSYFASLRCYYTHSTPLSIRVHQDMLNPDFLNAKPLAENVTPLLQHADGRFPPKTYRPAVHMAVGAGITTLLQLGALRYAAWPFLPAGYVASGSGFAGQLWFSLMLGWLAKTLIVRFGGNSLYLRLRPVFIGLIFGEGLAAAVWLIVSLVLAAGGYDYYRVTFLPT